MYQPRDYICDKYYVGRILSTNDSYTEYLCVNEKLNRIYIIRDYRLDNMDEVSCHELVRSLSRLFDVSHPHIVAPCEINETDHGILSIRESHIYGEGSDQPEKKYSNEDYLFWFKRLCETLGYLNTCTPFVLGGLTPDNIRICIDGNAFLVNPETVLEDTIFTVGLGAFSKSSEFAAPELCDRNAGIDVRSSIYSLGAVIFHLMTGQTPHPLSPNESGLLLNPESCITWGLESILTKCLQNSPEDRYQSYAELMYDLKMTSDPFFNPYNYHVPPSSIKVRIKKYFLKKRRRKFKKDFIANYSFKENEY